MNKDIRIENIIEMFLTRWINALNEGG